MDKDGYGRYIDERDGLPRWNLPPMHSRPKGLRWRYIKEAVRELYPDHGGRFVAERLGMPSKYVNVTMYASTLGVRRTEERRQMAYKEGAARLRRIYKMERARVMGGLPQVTRVNVGETCGPARHGRYCLRHKYVVEFGYYYCEGDAMVLLYDDDTRRRLPGRIHGNGFTEDDVTRKYGITFERVDDEDDGIEHDTS